MLLRMLVTPAAIHTWFPAAGRSSPGQRVEHDAQYRDLDVPAQPNARAVDFDFDRGCVRIRSLSSVDASHRTLGLDSDRQQLGDLLRRRIRQAPMSNPAPDQNGVECRSISDYSARMGISENTGQ